MLCPARFVRSPCGGPLHQPCGRGSRLAADAQPQNVPSPEAPGTEASGEEGHHETTNFIIISRQLWLAIIAKKEVPHHYAAPAIMSFISLTSRAVRLATSPRSAAATPSSRETSASRASASAAAASRAASA